MRSLILRNADCTVGSFIDLLCTVMFAAIAFLLITVMFAAMAFYLCTVIFAAMAFLRKLAGGLEMAMKMSSMATGGEGPGGGGGQGSSKAWKRQVRGGFL